MGAGQLSPDRDREANPGEAEVRRLILAGQEREAATAVLSLFGPELQVFLHRVLGDTTLVEEAYSSTCERMWRGLHGFRWESSLRSWCYVIARREASRCRSRGVYARANETTLSAAEALPAKEATHTVSTTRRAHLDHLRASLSVEDRDLLVLRVEQELSWKEIASAFLEEGAEGEAIAREAARLRQRFRAIRVTVAAALAASKGQQRKR